MLIGSIDVNIITTSVDQEYADENEEQSLQFIHYSDFRGVQKYAKYQYATRSLYFYNAFVRIKPKDLCGIVLIAFVIFFIPLRQSLIFN